MSESEAGGMSSAQRGYGYSWRKARAEKLLKTPYCEFTRDGRICGRRATTVDHRTPQGGDDLSNLRSGCADCHLRHTARQTGLGTHVGVGRDNIAKNHDTARRRRDWRVDPPD